MTMIFGIPLQAFLGQLLVGLINGSFYAMLSLGLAIIFRIRARLAAFVATTMLCSFALLVWLPRVVAHPERQNSWGGTAITLAVAGAAWMVADTLEPVQRWRFP